jgi:hypothetical protein
MNSSKNAGPMITAQTGWDEAFLVGTESELLTYAQNIVDAVNSAKADTFFGEETKTKEISGLIGEQSEVQFDWLVITKDNEQTLKLAEKIYKDADLGNL